MKIKGFEQLYAEENTWLNRSRKELVMGILRREISGPDKELLDVGAGSGFHIAALATYGKVDAVEVCEPGYSRFAIAGACATFIQNRCRSHWSSATTMFNASTFLVGLGTTFGQ